MSTRSLKNGKKVEVQLERTDWSWLGIRPAYGSPVRGIHRHWVIVEIPEELQRRHEKLTEEMKKLAGELSLYYDPALKAAMQADFEEEERWKAKR